MKIQTNSPSPALMETQGTPKRPPLSDGAIIAMLMKNNELYSSRRKELFQEHFKNLQEIFKKTEDVVSNYQSQSKSTLGFGIGSALSSLAAGGASIAMGHGLKEFYSKGFTQTFSAISEAFTNGGRAVQSSQEGMRTRAQQVVEYARTKLETCKNSMHDLSKTADANEAAISKLMDSMKTMASLFRR